jgi:hypothetical protein
MIYLGKVPLRMGILVGASFQVLALICGIVAWKYNRAKALVLLVVLLLLYVAMVSRQTGPTEPSVGNGPTGTESSDARF